VLKLEQPWYNDIELLTPWLHWIL